MVAAAASSPAAAPVLRYGGDAAFGPFEWLDAQGRAQGFQLDLLAAMAPLAGVRFDVVLAPWARTERAFAAGDVDLVAMVDTRARRAHAHFLRPHATPAFGLYVRRGTPLPQSLQDLAGRRVAVLDSAPMGDTVADWLGGLRESLLTRGDAAAALAAVQRGQADAALLPVAYAVPALTGGAAPDVVAAPALLRLQSYAFALTPARAGWAPRLQAALDALEADGRLEALRRRWLASHAEAEQREALGRARARESQLAWLLAIGGTAAGAALAGLGVVLHRRSRRLRDETRRRRDAEARLARAEAQVERLFMHHPDAMIIVEPAAGRVRDCNPAMTALLGIPAESLVGQPLAALDRHVSRDTVSALAGRLAESQVLDAEPLRLTDAAGQARDTLLRVQPTEAGGERLLLCVVRDVTAQVQADAALRADYDALAMALDSARADAAAAQAAVARADATVHQFTRSVVHDLRAPLRATQGFAGLLQDRLRAGRADDVIAFSEQIERAVRRMNDMLTALAGLADVQRHPLQRRPLDMDALVHQTWTTLSAPHEAGEVVLEASPLPAAQGDPTLMALAWHHLLDNARRFSHGQPSARVRVDSTFDDAGVWYHVRDNGRGFDRDAAGDRLFQPFQRMHAAGPDAAGVGIGLSIVHRIVRHHGGELRVDSRPGGGTWARFTLAPAPPG